MAVQKITDYVFSVGSKDFDRRLFDELVPLPDGTSYNAYLILGSEKTVLIDSVDPEKTHELLNHLDKLNVQKIDYIVSNHAEQDHSGAIPAVLQKYPESKVVTNPRCKEFLETHLLINSDKFITVEDREKLSLGNKTLEFIYTPWVHWPETMTTYLHEDKIMFTCDFFGSHLATSNLFVQNPPKVLEDAKRYYSEIMMPFRKFIRKNIEKLSAYDYKYIAPSHGPIYDNPSLIVDAYNDWISDEVRNIVLIPYVSMHGSTEVMANYLTDSLIDKGIRVKPFNLTKTDIGELAMALVDAATIILGTPTVLVGPHPATVYAATLVNELKPKVKFASIFGSFGWGGKAVDIITKNLSNLDIELISPVLCKGLPRKEDFEALERMAKSIEEKHRSINLL